MTSSDGPSIKNSTANDASLQNQEIKHPQKNKGTDLSLAGLPSRTYQRGSSGWN